MLIAASGSERHRCAALLRSAWPSAPTCWQLGVRASAQRSRPSPGRRSRRRSTTMPGSPGSARASRRTCRIGTATWSDLRARAATCAPGPRLGGAGCEAGPGRARDDASRRAPTYQGVAYVVRSPAWNGIGCRPSTRPCLQGPPRRRPEGDGRSAAHWTGGWARPGDVSFLHVEACRTAKARRCVTLSAQGEDYPRQRRSARRRASLRRVVPVRHRRAATRRIPRSRASATPPRRVVPPVTGRPDGRPLAAATAR